METTTVPSLNTKLTDRILWYDGDSTLDEKSINRLISCGESTVGVFVEMLTPEIKQYNKFVDKEEKLDVKVEVRPFHFDWQIPDEYKDINVEIYIAEKLLTVTEGLSDLEYTERVNRYLNELELYRKLELMDVLRTLIFVINTLIENNVVWGVGRGSSAASYVLYLMGVHDVDSFKYGLNIEEFLRTE